MKKLLVLLMGILLVLTGCSNEEKNYVEISSFDVDMSGYEGMSATDHHFRGITPEEFIRVYEEDGTAVFYIGYTECPNCQSSVATFEEAATETDATIYYLDPYSEEYDFFAYMDDLTTILDPILRHEDGQAIIYTPHIFAMVNGEFKTSLIGNGDKLDEVIALIEETK